MRLFTLFQLSFGYVLDLVAYHIPLIKSLTLEKKMIWRFFAV